MHVLSLPAKDPINSFYCKSKKPNEKQLESKGRSDGVRRLKARPAVAPALA